MKGSDKGSGGGMAGESRQDVRVLPSQLEFDSGL